MNFEDELSDINNVRIMRKAAQPFAKQLTKEELENCQLIALWKAVGDFDPNKGSKFTSILFNRVRWECLRELRTTKPIDAAPITSSGTIPDRHEYFGGINDLIGDIPAEYHDVLYQRFVEDKTFAEIGENNGYTGENARVKTKKAIAYLKEFVEI